MDTIYLLPILLNIGNLFFLLCYLSRDIFWLRSFVIIGSLTLLPWYYLQENPLWAPMGWAFVYISINIGQLTLLYLERRRITLTEIEQQLYEIAFDSLQPRTFHKLVNLGSFEEAERNTLLIKSEEYIDKLYVVAEGEVEVTLHDRTTRVIGRGGFIGEQSFVTGGKTSADVRVSTDKALLLTWEKESLQKFLDKNLVLSNTFDLIISSDVINKLRRMGRQELDHGGGPEIVTGN